MALSKRFEILRKLGGDGDAVIDPSFLHEKIHVVSQIAPRHSWGGTASSQTKIDVQDEDLESIKGNLAYRFKAAKQIYARYEDLAVEPLGRDESVTGRSQLNKTTLFNVEKLLGYNSRPCRLDEMGVKLYFKYNDYRRKQLLSRQFRDRANTSLPTMSFADDLHVHRKRPFAEVADDSSLVSASKRENLAARVASKSCLPRVVKFAEDHLECLEAGGGGVDRGSPLQHPHSSSSTESASSSQMAEEVEAAPEPVAHREVARSATSASASDTAMEVGVDHSAAQQFPLTASDSLNQSLDHRREAEQHVVSSSFLEDSRADLNSTVLSVTSALAYAADNRTRCSSHLEVKEEAENNNALRSVMTIPSTEKPSVSSDEPGCAATTSSANSPTVANPSEAVAASEISHAATAATVAPSTKSAAITAKVTASNSKTSSTSSSGEKKKKTKPMPKEIPQVPVAGYDRADPRSYDEVSGGCLVAPKLQFLDKGLLVNCWLKYEDKLRRKNNLSPSENDADYDIFLDNWRSLVSDTTLADSSTANAKGDGHDK